MATAVLFVAALPQILVFIWTMVDRNAAGHQWGAVRDAMEAARRELDLSSSVASAQTQGKLASIAIETRVRLRIFSPAGEVLFEKSADDPAEAIRLFENFLFGRGSDQTVEELDEALGPILSRDSYQMAARGSPYIGCRYLGLLFCEAVAVEEANQKDGAIIVAQATSQLAVQPIYALRAQLLRMGLFTLPLAFFLAWYAGLLVASPLERLQKQALARVTEATHAASLSHAQADEVGDLTNAFNLLLSTMAERRAEHERFAADLVHEMKNPVAAIRASAEALAGGGTSKDRLDRLASVLEQSSAKLDRLVTQFLELARAEAGLPNEPRARIDLGTLATRIAETTRTDARYESLQIEVHVPALPVSILAVPHRAEALVRELVDNAASFASPNGAVRIDVTKLGDRARLAVRDTGPGIAADDLPRVYDRFFTTRGERRGTGLGLALVKAVAEAHGGRVSATSETGRGSTFEVTLPLA